MFVATVKALDEQLQGMRTVIHAMAQSSACTSSSVQSPEACSEIDRDKESIMRAHNLALRSIYAHANELLLVASTRYNRFTPIYRLPNDVLIIIFEFAMPIWSEKLRPSKYPPLTLAQVSKRWREVSVSLHTSMLWNQIRLSKEPLVDLLLSRSRSAPLDIMLSCEPFLGSSLLRPTTECQIYNAHSSLSLLKYRLIDEIRRWRSFAFSSPHTRDVGNLESLLLRCSAPILQKFHCEVVTDPHEHLPEQHILPSNLFCGDTPCLTELHLQSIASVNSHFT